ncbi:MAG TPA: XRE family transcriptional regulator [Pilimelia sp.]|nr:XRE family transcriptional regulator [Pilimelia sp.]
MWVDDGRVMPATEVPWLGERIRAERVRQGISLRALARTVGVSASMISQIETSKAQPSVSTLYAITTALGISIEDLFTAPVAAPEAASVVAERAAAEVAEGTPVGVQAGSPRPVGPGAPDTDPAAAAPGTGPAAALEALVSIRGGGLGPLVRPDERRLLTLDSGVTWEMLGDLPGRAVDFLLITYPPGGTSGTNGALMRHPGSEYGFVIRGELILTLGFEEIRLRPGDAISFESTTPHGYRNEGTEPAVGVWFVLERNEPVDGR